MKILILIVLFFSVISCKKEVENSANQKKDTALTTNKLANDSLASTTKIVAESGVFKFVTELCDNKGYFDPTKYSREEIEGTYKLWFQMGGISLSTHSVFSPEDLEKVRNNKDIILTKLDKDFAANKKILENLKIVPIPYWQNIKKTKYSELHQEYEKNKIQIASYSDPSVLINNTFTGNCKNFAKALNSGDDEIIAEWRKLREEMSKRNGNPQRIMNDFENHLNSSNWKDHALIDLITFGWGNCANDHIERPLYDEKMNNEFDSLFTKIDSECDEP